MVLTLFLQLATVPLFALTFTLDPMVAPRDPVLSLSNLPMTLAMLSNNSTAMTGKVGLSKFVRIASLAPDLDLAEVASVLEVDLVEGLVVVADSEDEVDSEEDLEDEGAVLEVATVEEVLVSMDLHLLLFRMPSLIMLRRALREARQSTSAT